MLVFVIPLKSKLVSHSWSTVSSLFERTLKSVCNQTSPDFKVIVVCHEQPSIEFEHKNIEYIMVDFSPPKLIGEPTEDHTRKETDHAKKLWLGSVYAESLNPSHVMFVDSDDLVSRRLATFTDGHIRSNGWYINQGFEYPSKENVIYPKSKFYTKCGTSNIIRYDLLKPLLEAHLDQVDARNGAPYMRHKLQRRYLANTGNPLLPLPFEGAVYVTGHGDNIFLEYFSRKQKNLLDYGRLYGGKLRKRLVARPITNEIRDEFGL